MCPLLDSVELTLQWVKNQNNPEYKDQKKPEYKMAEGKKVVTKSLRILLLISKTFYDSFSKHLSRTLGTLDNMCRCFHKMNATIIHTRSICQKIYFALFIYLTYFLCPIPDFYCYLWEGWWIRMQDSRSHIDM